MLFLCLCVLEYGWTILLFVMCGLVKSLMWVIMYVDVLVIIHVFMFRVLFDLS